MSFVFLCHSQASVVLYRRALGSGVDDGRAKRGLWGSRIGQHFHPRAGGLGDNAGRRGFSWEVAAKPLAVTPIQGRKEEAKKPFIIFVKVDHEDFFWRNFGGLIYQSGQPI